jgi:hypothetical protein
MMQVVRPVVIFSAKMVLFCDRCMDCCHNISDVQWTFSSTDTAGMLRRCCVLLSSAVAV